MKKDRIDDIMSVYEIMRNVRKLSFRAQSLESSSQMDWNYTGEGDVRVEEESGKLYFFEEIILDNGAVYKDKKLWNFNENCIEFWRFRNREYEKIFEFMLENWEFILKEKYVCVPDLYFGNIQVLRNKICFLIKIRGEKKDEILEYAYLQ